MWGLTTYTILAVSSMRGAFFGLIEQIRVRILSWRKFFHPKKQFEFFVCLEFSHTQCDFTFTNVVDVSRQMQTRSGKKRERHDTTTSRRHYTHTDAHHTQRTHTAQTHHTSIPTVDVFLMTRDKLPNALRLLLFCSRSARQAAIDPYHLPPS